MANRSMEQIILDEHNRVTRGAAGTAAKPAGLPDLTHPATSALAGTSTTQPKVAQPTAVSAAKTFSNAAQTLAASQINKGYTAPAPATQSSTSAPASGGSAAGTTGNATLKVFTSGLGLMPLVSGLAGLFGGGEPTTPAPLAKYAMPRSIQIAAANSKGYGSFQFADHSQDGTVRPYSEPSGGSSPAAGSSAPLWPAAGQSQGGGSATQVVVNVQAMDSRSFLDHSQEIAQAVREAMLNMHALNDVVSEL